MDLEGGKVGIQLGQPVVGCPGWAHVEQTQEWRGAHKGKVCREGQTQR